MLFGFPLEYAFSFAGIPSQRGIHVVADAIAEAEAVADDAHAIQPGDQNIEIRAPPAPG